MANDSQNWLSVIKPIAPRGDAKIEAGLADMMPELIKRYSINTPLRQAHFLGQCAHESDGFRTTTEYGGDRYFAKYDGRKDLGNVIAGDGPRFRGRGIIQLTGRANYRAYGSRIGMDLIKEPLDAAAFPAAALTAGAFWQDKGLNALADKDDLLGITRRINGGTNGLASRRSYVVAAKKALVPAPMRPVAFMDEPQPTGWAIDRSDGGKMAVIIGVSLVVVVGSILLTLWKVGF